MYLIHCTAHTYFEYFKKYSDSIFFSQRHVTIFLRVKYFSLFFKNKSNYTLKEWHAKTIMEKTANEKSLTFIHKKTFD